MKEQVPLGHDEIQAAATSVRNQGPGFFVPKIGIVLGSGLGKLASRIQNAHSITYSRIAHMPQPTVQGHDGQLTLGKIGETNVACLSGRVHLYEGHAPDKVVFGIRLLAALGADIVIITNAAGGISQQSGPGSFMLITDHLNLTGQNPLYGPNDARLGPRFPDMTLTYDRELLDLAERSASDLQVPFHRGIYAGVLGPSYETPAEVALLHQCGASAVGMSTVHEAIAARHQGSRILGISCITNFAAGRARGELKHDDVAATAERGSETFCSLLETICRNINRA